MKAIQKQKSEEKDGKAKGWNAAINDHEKQVSAEQTANEIRDSITTSVLACL